MRGGFTDLVALSSVGCKPHNRVVTRVQKFIVGHFEQIHNWDRFGRFGRAASGGCAARTPHPEGGSTQPPFLTSHVLQFLPVPWGLSWGEWLLGFLRPWVAAPITGEPRGADPNKKTNRRPYYSGFHLPWGCTAWTPHPEGGSAQPQVLS